MFTTHDWRGRHRQAARNLSIAVASAVLAGSGAALAADHGAAPSPTKPAADGPGCAKPGPAKGERVPLMANDDIVTQVRVKRPIFSDPIIWNKSVTVNSHGTADVNFTLGERTPQMAQGH